MATIFWSVACIKPTFTIGYLAGRCGSGYFGSVPEWLKGTGCKPVGVSLRWFESTPAHFERMADLPFEIRLVGHNLIYTSRLGKKRLF